MTLCDPFAINFLAQSAMKIINHQVQNEALPRENAILHLLLRMMGLGLSAWDMIDTQEFMEPKLDTSLITQFVPSLMSLVVDDQVRAITAKLPVDEHESAITIIDHTGQYIQWRRGTPPPPPAPGSEVTLGQSVLGWVTALYGFVYIRYQGNLICCCCITP
jgi:hypothetical protein